MAKKSGSKGGGKSKASGLSAMEHRKKAAELHARARLHDAHADIKDAKNPPKNTGPMRGCY